MIKRLFFLSFIAFSFQGTFAQLGECYTPVAGFEADWCYSNEQFPDHCAQFKDGSADFYLVRKGKKTSKSKLALPAEGADLVDWLKSLAGNKKLKLTVADALYLERAIPEWEKAKMTLGMEKTASGLMYKINQKGDGKLPEQGKNVYVHYRGFLENGDEFDNSFKRGQPFSFPLGQGRVIKGWDEGIALLPVGSKALLRIPPELGYGARGAGGSIPPNAILFFEVEVINAD